ncbi:MAG: choice-of-anchor D domain-containing protein [Candidatus Latescibacteria bacterium]|nr:choice-of-anchor D domain-containing protein [Candidatus Latescibacterota bacterium]
MTRLLWLPLTLLILLSLTVPGWAQAPGTITTVAGNGTASFSGDDGPATAASLYSPSGIFVDSAGNLYIGDYRNNRIRKVDTNGVITTVAGNGTASFSGDDGPATAASLKLWYANVFKDGAGNLYIPDYYNNRIRKVDTNGVITTVAGNGTKSSAGDDSLATVASLNGPITVYGDSAGNLYISEWDGHRIRKVAPNGIITTVAGNGTASFSGDGGPATAASLNNPEGIFSDGPGNLYISDYNNNRVRKVDAATQIITTIAGGGPNSPGDGGPARAAVLSGPTSMFRDSMGNLYIAEWDGHRVRKVDPTGIITTVAGTGDEGFSGDDGPATAAKLDNPLDVAVDGTGNFYISDTGNHRVRKVTAVAALSLSPAAVDFGNLSVGQTANRTVTVTNSSFVPLTVSSLSLSGPDSGQFSVSPANLNVAAGGSQNVTVGFTPTSGGTKAASLSLQHNAPGGPTSIPLAGIGLTSVAVSIPTLFSRPNATVTIPVQISGVANATSIYSYSCTVDYGTSGLLTDPTVVLDGTLTQGSGIEVNPSIGAGKIRVTVARVLALASDGILLKIRFRVSATANSNDSTPLTLSDVLFNENNPTAVITNGTFRVAAGAFGDITLDGSVSALDASAALQTDVGLRSLTQEQTTTGDVSGNGAVTAFDAALILQFVVGQISTFPVQGTSKPLPDGRGPSVALPALRASPGDRVTVPVTLSEGRDVRAIGFTLRYDPAALRFVEVVRGSLPAGAQLVVHADPAGAVRVASAGTAPLPGSGELVQVVFDVVGAPGARSSLSFDRFHANEAAVQTGTGEVVVQRVIPSAFALDQNVPNPFNPATAIRYALKERGHVTLRVYNLLGQVVTTLVDGPQEAGVYTARWNGRTTTGAALAGGVYFYQLQVTGREPFLATRKMILIK